MTAKLYNWHLISYIAIFLLTWQKNLNSNQFFMSIYLFIYFASSCVISGIMYSQIIYRDGHYCKVKLNRVIRKWGLFRSNDWLTVHYPLHVVNVLSINVSIWEAIFSSLMSHLFSVILLTGITFFKVTRHFSDTIVTKWHRKMLSSN